MSKMFLANRQALLCASSVIGSIIKVNKTEQVLERCFDKRKENDYADQSVVCPFSIIKFLFYDTYLISFRVHSAPEK